MDRRSAGLQRLFELRECRQRLPRDRELAQVKRRNSCRIAADRRNSLAEESRFALRKHRLIGKLWNYPEAIFSRNVARGENPMNPGMRAPERLQVAKREFRAVMRRAHHAEQQGILRPFIGAENILAQNFFLSIEPGDSLSHGTILSRRCRYRWGLICFQHGLNDFPVAGATAKSTAERVHHLRFVWARIFFQQRNGGKQHGGSEDTALRRPVLQERFLQPVES